MSSLKEAALAYANRGWAIFPCRADKEPMTEHGVMEATTNPAVISAWWDRWPKANIGLHAGEAGFMVLDHDSYKPDYSRAALEKALGSLPTTKLRARTPRGGEHEYYALTPGEVISPSASKLAPHVDVRSFNSYVLLPPSRTADGIYEWIEEGKPAFRTDEMVRLANSYREKDANRDQWLIEPDLDENVASAIKWLKTDAKIAIQGQGGDNKAYATAAMLKSFGISEALAFDLMWEHWNPRCVPAWTADEVEHLEAKVRNGYSYNTSPPGNITPAYRAAKSQSLFKPVQRELPSGKEFSAGRFRIVDREGMSHVRAPEWLIPDFLPQGGYGLLVGAPGTFKTFIALDIALSVATGANFPWKGMWGSIGETGPVLFTLGEGRPEFTKRVQAWETTHWAGKKASNIWLGDPVPLVSAGDDEWDHFFDAALAAQPDGYKLLVLDTVGRAMQGLNESAQENASLFTRRVEECQRYLKCAVLALHHTGYDANGRPRGSSVFMGDPDTVVSLDRQTKGMLVTMTMNKQKDATEWEKPRQIRLNEVRLGPKTTSLVAVAPTAGEKEQAMAPLAQKTRDKVMDMLVTSTLDRSVAAVLQANPSRVWTQRDLAEALAMRPEVEVGSEMLRKRLTSLREDKATNAHRCYDAPQKRWRWIAPPA